MLRKHFSTHPSATITDLKLSYTPDGKFRRFAFIGFASEGEATAVRKHFDGTYFDTMRMQVEEAIPVGDAALPRAWSKYTKAKEEAQRAVEEVKNSPTQTDDDAQRDAEAEKKRKFLFSIYGESDQPDAAELERYLTAMRPKSRTKTWENDDSAALDASLIDPKTGAKLKKRVKVAVESVKVRKAGGQGLMVPKVHMKFADEEQEKVEFEKSDEEELYEDFPVKREVVEAMELSSNDEKITNETKNDSVTSKTKATTQATFQATTSQQKTYAELDPALIAETGRLFIRNLSYACTESDLQSLFSPFGPLSAIHLPIAQDTKKIKGFAYVLFTVPDDAVRAYTELDGKVFQGRLLHILPAHEQKEKESSSSTNPSSSSTTNFKAQKDAQLKASAASTHNWNSLFIRADAVLDAVAAKLGVPKSSIMDTHSSAGSNDLSLATRLAVAETHIIQETKEYLESQGVLLDAFNSASKERSNLIILVKNLPFSVDPEALRKQFSRFGALKRFIMPPATKSIALVEFLEQNEAKAAFRGMAYTKFESAPLFLEWAPINCLSGAVVESVSASASSTSVTKSSSDSTSVTESTVITPSEPSSTEPSEPSSHCLFVKNLSFNTTEDALHRLFSSIAPLRSLRIPRKQPGNLSMGFGFIEFNSRDDLNRALDRLQGVQLDGHALELKLQASKNDAVSVPSSKKRNQLHLSEAELESLRPCKLLLKNIPFEASERELRALITSFTPALKRLRLPKKFDGGLRGFGFAELGSHGEAKHLMEQLGATHFYGRHLVIEWAKTDSSEEK